MQSYLLAAEQIKYDVAEEYARLYPGPSVDDVYQEAPNGKLVEDNLEIFFRNAAKNKLFSMRVRKQDSNEEEFGDLIQAYITSSDSEAYQDTLDSIKCCKKISYLLFVSQYEKFRLNERTKYSELLRKQEQRYPQHSIEIYNQKKALCTMMAEGKPLYTHIASAATRYLNSIQETLQAQKKVYQVECELVQIFVQYLDFLLSPDCDVKNQYNNPSVAKALINVLKTLDDRGLELPDIPKKLSTDFINEVRSVLDEHTHNLSSEIGMIDYVIQFIEDVVKFSDDASVSREKKSSKDDDDGGWKSVLENLPSTFKEWLSK